MQNIDVDDFLLNSLFAKQHCPSYYAISNDIARISNYIRAQTHINAMFYCIWRGAKVSLYAMTPRKWKQEEWTMYVFQLWVNPLFEHQIVNVRMKQEYRLRYHNTTNN